MKKIILSLTLIFGAIQAMETNVKTSSLIPGAINKGKKLIIFTDLEADDSVAIALLLKCLHDQGVKDTKNFSFDALLSNQYRKKALLQKLVELFGYSDTAVFAGTGGIKEPFEEEGKNILISDRLEKFRLMDQSYYISKDPKKHKCKEITTHFIEILNNAQNNSIDVLLLTTPLDFVNTINGDKNLFQKIDNIYMMGGWYNNKPSFNWSMHIKSVQQLLNLMEASKELKKSPQLVIFSSHFFAREFNGYVNQAKFPEVISAFDKNNHPIIRYLHHMIKNWDDSMTVVKDYHNKEEIKWRLEMVERIGSENIGRQFAPADPVTVIGYLYPEQFIIKKIPVNISLIDSKVDDKKSYTVEIETDLSSNIFLVEKVDLKFFNDKLVELMSLSY